VSTTYVAEEVEMQFTRNRAGEQILDVQEDKQTAKATSREHCRHCKGNDHWSTNCPYKCNGTGACCRMGGPGIDVANVICTHAPNARSVVTKLSESYLGVVAGAK
ncbi:hypothetical protein ANCDUO_25950, partial [Ancylostoma duodenale]